jgi:MFS transporter, SP family, general alpha glucoside:H+ symporter
MAVAGEVSSVSLRSKTIGVGIAFNYLFSTIWLVVLPYLFNEDEANLGGKIGFVFFGQALLFMAAVWFAVPNTNGRTYEELDQMFESRVHTRKFSTWQPDHDITAAAAKAADL